MIYRHALVLPGDVPRGDLFRSVEVRLALSVIGGLLPNSTLSSIDFTTDVDFATYAAPVPAPHGAATALAGLPVLLPLDARRRRRRP